jgi:methyltransferase (TIGR00027 family)
MNVKALPVSIGPGGVNSERLRMKAGEASMTARRVAAQRLSFPRVATVYGRPEADQQLQANVAGDLDISPTTMTRYLEVRTAFFDRVVVESIAGGIDQIVVLGAGYDGRSLRYAKAGLRWFELDHPDTQADKRSRLDRLGISSVGVVFAAVEFGVDDVAGALGQAGLDALRPTLFACEGVAAYLPLATLSSMLASISGYAGPGSTLAISISLETESPSEESRRSLLRAAVARMGEPLVSAVRRSELGGFLGAAGWTVGRATDPAGVDIIDSERSTAFVLAARS